MKAVARTTSILAIAASIAGCNEKSAPQTPAKQTTPAPASSPPPATPAPAPVDEQQLAKGFVDFAARFAKQMNEKYYAGDTWIVESADVERTQAVLQPYKGKLVCKIRAAEGLALAIHGRVQPRG